MSDCGYPRVEWCETRGLLRSMEHAYVSPKVSKGGTSWERLFWLGLDFRAMSLVLAVFRFVEILYWTSMHGLVLVWYENYGDFWLAHMARRYHEYVLFYIISWKEGEGESPANFASALDRCVQQFLWFLWRFFRG